RFVGLSLLGVVCLSASGVVMGLALPFLVGYGVYAAWRYYRSGEKPQVQAHIVEPAKQVAQAAYQGSRKVSGGLFSFIGKAIGGVFWLAGSIIGGGWTLASEVIAGTILGAALGVMIGMPTNTDRYLVFVGAGGGALLGLANAFGSFRSKQRMAQLKRLELAVARG
ncbi:MAG TPA: hypothetical protein PLX97_15390, partial [Gemmatales bacterium]|nr:hypothetical protein [Gemmatales bacterium]